MDTENEDKRPETTNEELGKKIILEMCKEGIIDPNEKGIFEIAFIGGEKIRFKVSDEE